MVSKFNTDKAVLENHHVSAAFILSQKENYNIFGKFSKEDYSKLRERVITMVLCTDMSTHFNDLSKVKGRLATTGFIFKMRKIRLYVIIFLKKDFDLKDKDKNLCMETLLHASDISNPIKPFDICFQWTDRVLQEFWRQVKIFGHFLLFLFKFN